MGAFDTGVLEAWEWAWGRFFIYFSRVSVFERAWAWGVFSPMTDGSVGAFLFIFNEFRCLNGGGRGAFFHQ